MIFDKYVLVTDFDYQWYIIPEKKIKDWKRWCNLDEDDEESSYTPKYAHHIGDDDDVKSIRFRMWGIRSSE